MKELHLKQALLVALVGVQEHVKLLVGPRRHICKDAVLRRANAPAGSQERKAVQVLEACKPLTVSQSGRQLHMIALRPEHMAAAANHSMAGSCTDCTVPVELS